ncbi:MAG: glycosyltransferase family 39 protein [Candidatus Spechtbacterales bacterium]
MKSYLKFPQRSTATALVILGIMGVVALMSIREDSVTMDESPHIVSGYSYLKFQDMRLNPEHPPLVKDLAAIPLLFQKINFPLDHPAWSSMVNAQWDLGPQFLYRSGNDPDKIIFWGRIGPILLMLLFGWFVFKWARELFGAKWGLFTLSLFAFSPTIMAHGRLVTTDVPAAFAFFAAIYYYLKFLKNPSKKNLLIAGVVFAIAQLLKFSLVLLLGFLPTITVFWILLHLKSVNIFRRDVIKTTVLWGARFFAILAITALLILPVYQFHVSNYPPEKQAQDIRHILQDGKFPALTDALVWMSDKPLLRAYAQYLLGVSMVFMRVAGGNTTYFLGEVSNQAWWYYFPVAFFFKVPGAILVFIALSVILLLKRTFSMAILQKNFVEVAMLLFVIFYWVISITGNLNIGVRHVLPTFPFIYLLIAGQMKRWLFQDTKNAGRAIFIAVLLVWYIGLSIGIYPHYIAYFNEFAGGPANGYKYVVDSNLDWGQDLRRLKKFVEEKNIDRIKVDYFGGGDVKYYLGERAEIWHADNGETTGWLAVSATFLQTSRAYPRASYEWLDKYAPVKKIGFSMFVYNIEN